MLIGAIRNFIVLNEKCLYSLASLGKSQSILLSKIILSADTTNQICLGRLFFSSRKE